MTLRRGVILTLVSTGNVLLWIGLQNVPIVWRWPIAAGTFYLLAGVYALLTRPRSL